MDSKSLGMLFFSGKFFRALWLVRGPLFIGILIFYLENTRPFKEFIRIFAEDKFHDLQSQVVFAIALLLLLTTLLWRISRELFLVSDFLEIYNFRMAKWVRCVVPAIVASLPMFGLAVAAHSEYGDLAEIQVARIEPAADAQQSQPWTAETVSSEDIAEAAEQAKSDFAPSDQAKDAFETARRQIRLPGATQQAAPLKTEEGRLTKAEYDTYEELSRALQSTKASQITFMYLFIIGFVGASLIIIGSLFYDFWSGKASQASAADKLPKSLRLNWFWLVFLVVCVLLFGFQGSDNTTFRSMNPTQVARWVGTPGLIFLFFSFLALLVSLATRIFDKHSIPVISLVVLAGIVSANFETSSNHTVRRLDKKPAPPLPLFTAFQEWLEQRPGALDADGYAQTFKDNFPVYLFAMEGGGHYASILSSLTLAKLVDRCPALRHHIFAVSGVSGGGIGAGIFVAALKSALAANDPWVVSTKCDFTLSVLGIETGDDSGRLEKRILAFQKNDFLSPLAASALFGDLPQRAIPISVPELDRARAFEAGLESLAAKAGFTDGKGNILEEDFLDQWSPNAGTPMLILNTTRVQTGEPTIIAPLAVGRSVPNGSELKSIYSDALVDYSIRLSTALGLTARFPFLAPVGTLKTDERLRNAHYDLVDGGYFENSGADALIALLNELSFYKAHPEVLNVYPGDPQKRDLFIKLLKKVRFKVYVLHQISDDRHDRETVFEVSAPVDTLYRARQQRTNIAIDRIGALDNVDADKIIFANRFLNIPLQWHLAPSSVNAIRSLVGTPDYCPRGENSYARRSEALKIIKNAYGKTTITPKAAEEVGRMFYYMMRNRCVLREIIEPVALR